MAEGMALPRVITKCLWHGERMHSEPTAGNPQSDTTGPAATPVGTSGVLRPSSTAGVACQHVVDTDEPGFSFSML